MAVLVKVVGNVPFFQKVDWSDMNRKWRCVASNAIVWLGLYGFEIPSAQLAELFAPLRGFCCSDTLEENPIVLGSLNTCRLIRRAKISGLAKCPCGELLGDWLKYTGVCVVAVGLGWVLVYFGVNCRLCHTSYCMECAVATY